MFDVPSGSCSLALAAYLFLPWRHACRGSRLGPRQAAQDIHTVRLEPSLEAKGHGTASEVLTCQRSLRRRAVRELFSCCVESDVQVDHVRGGFNQFGEAIAKKDGRHLLVGAQVAHISASHGYALVEFYDIRAAQALLAASMGTAVPWTRPSESSGVTTLPSLGSGNWPLPNAFLQGANRLY